MQKVKWYRLKNNAVIPRKAHQNDACFDLYLSEDIDLEAGQRMLVGLGFCMAVPEGWEAQIRPRSGLAINFGITILNTPGTIDSGYRGEVGVILYNTGNRTVEFVRGFKIAQMSFRPIYDVVFEEVESEELLGETSRGGGGFGSTG